MRNRLSSIVARASSLQERLRPEFAELDAESSSDIVDARLRRWREIVAQGDTAAFAQRLAWDGLDEASARRALGACALRPDAALPSWANVLAEVLGSTEHAEARDRCLDAGHPVPFEDLLLPFVRWARAACQQAAGAAYARFEAAAQASLERQLLEWLSLRAARTFALELSLELAEQHSDFDRLLSQSEPSRAGYAAFVARQLDSGLLELFEEYSVLARVLATTAELWVAATAELVTRFCAHAEELQNKGFIGADLRVVGVDAALSDPHRGLRGVAILTLGSGHRIVYKPRELGIELGWNELLAELTRWGAPLALRTFRVLDCGSYGFVEHVASVPVRDAAEARRYFEHAGALLAVVYLLEGVDCHAGNVIGSGEQPVLIDVETLLCPVPRESTRVSDAVRVARERLAHSVLATYLLPCWSRNIEQPDEVFDGSGFGAERDPDHLLTRRRWSWVNTDAMALGRTKLDASASVRAERADGGALGVSDFETELVNGFVAMYHFLLSTRAALLAEASPFQRLQKAEVRFVFRRTSVYGVLLERLRRPELLRDGVERSLQIEQLASAALSNTRHDARPGWVAIWRSERDAVERGDVPYFSALAGDDALRLEGGIQIDGWFAEPSHRAVLRRFSTWSENDLAFQVDLMRSAVRARAPRESRSERVTALRNAKAPPVKERTVTGSALWLEEALAIADGLAESAIRGADGSAAWLEPAWSREQTLAANGRELDVVRESLYDGAVGIGLFLAAAAQSSGRSDLGELALGAVRPVLLELELRGEELVSELGIGGLSGLGSIAYGLVSMARLLAEPSLLNGAERAAALITSARIDADAALDVSAGSAGALLGLLALHSRTQNPSTLGSAQRCAERLLSRVESTPSGERSIRSLDGNFLAGFAHGAAGFAYALVRLHQVAPDPRLIEAASALWDFERSVYSSELGDWPDLRLQTSTRRAGGFCHGAPGIALGRLGSEPEFSDARHRTEIERALAATIEHAERTPDHLCCGGFGRVETLAVAARVLGRPELRDRAERLSRVLLVRAWDAGGYTLAQPPSGQLACRGLFQGLAGIGFTLLRLAKPDALPEPLLLR